MLPALMAINTVAKGRPNVFFYSPIFPAMDLLDTFGEEFLRESIAFFTTVEIVEAQGDTKELSTVRYCGESYDSDTHGTVNSRADNSSTITIACPAEGFE